MGLGDDDIDLVDDDDLLDEDDLKKPDPASLRGTVKPDGWMTGNFMPFSIIFHSYQDEVMLIMQGCVQ